MASVRWIGALLLVLPLALAAQDSPRADDSVFAQAQRLVAEGRGEEGRALVERTLASASAGSAAYAAALYWRGVMAPTAAEAERDLRRVIVEFSLSPHADDALLRLAQLEIARGDRVRATEHLDRLLAEHPTSNVRPRAQLTMARMSLDAGQIASGCAQLRELAASSGPGEIEIRNQVTFLQQRCSGDQAGTRVAGATSPASRPPVSARTPPNRQASTQVDTSVAEGRIDPVAPRVTYGAAGTPAPRAAAPATGSAGFSVQVGAFSSPEQATKVQRELTGRGYQARVVPGPRDLHRVRVGRYPDRAAADAALGRMKSSGVTGMVVEAEPR
jgi:cell division septation protein DedD